MCYAFLGIIPFTLNKIYIVFKINVAPGFQVLDNELDVPTANERPTSNKGYAAGDGDGGQTCTLCESFVSYSCHTVGDNSVLASENQAVGLCFYEGVAVISGVIYGIVRGYDNAFKGGASPKSLFTYAIHAVGDIDRHQTGVIESPFTYTIHAVGNGDACQS
jgi:hypothetical protein